jgi:hypothetical protein
MLMLCWMGLVFPVPPFFISFICWYCVGFGHMLANGQTTLCEAWGCNSHDSDNGSFNHIMSVICGSVGSSGIVFAYMVRAFSALAAAIHYRTP